jgi:hypothetical protein
VNAEGVSCPFFVRWIRVTTLLSLAVFPVPWDDVCKRLEAIC